MDKKETKQYSRIDESQLNPAGSSRRRLMRILGGTSGTALSGLMASGWVKPVLKTVALPAHAEMTQLPCQNEVGWTLEMQFLSGTGNLTMRIGLIDGVSVEKGPSMFGSVSGATLSDSATVGLSNTDFIGFNFSYSNATADLLWTFIATCCNDTLSTSAAFAPSDGFNNASTIFQLTYTSDAECTLSFEG